MSTPEVLDVKSRIFSIAEEVGALGLVDDLRTAHEESYWHSVRVAITAHEIAGFLGRSEAFSDIVGVAGLVHDVGKAEPEIARLVGLDRKLTRAEKAVVDQHSYVGMRYLKNILSIIPDNNNSDVVLPAVYVAHNHHEDLTKFSGDAGKKLVVAAVCVQTADRIDARYDPARSRFTDRVIAPEDDLVHGRFLAQYLLHPSERQVVEPSGESLLDAPRFDGVSIRNVLTYAHQNWQDIYDSTSELVTA